MNSLWYRLIVEVGNLPVLRAIEAHTPMETM